MFQKNHPVALFVLFQFYIHLRFIWKSKANERSFFNFLSSHSFQTYYLQNIPVFGLCLVCGVESGMITAYNSDAREAKLNKYFHISRFSLLNLPSILLGTTYTYFINDEFVTKITYSKISCIGSNRAKISYHFLKDLEKKK